MDAKGETNFGFGLDSKDNAQTQGHHPGSPAVAEQITDLSDLRNGSPGEKPKLDKNIATLRRVYERRFSTAAITGVCTEPADFVRRNTLPTLTPVVPRVHDHWSSELDFLMSCIASSVGLGNVWRFPFTAIENGGGAFLIPYIIVLFLVGKPMYYLEVLIGQFSSRGNIKAFDFAPIMRGIGYAEIFVSAVVSTYYGSLMALTLRYLFASFSSELPWAFCKPTWPNCFDSKLEDQQNQTLFTNVTDGMKSSSHYYFTKEILREPSDGLDSGLGLPDRRLALCLFTSWACIFLVLIRGIRSSGKVAYFLAVYPFIALLALLIRALTLTGAYDGIKYFFTPQWGALLNHKVWYAAITQMFFSLTIGLGNIVTYASYNKFRHNVRRDTIILTYLDTFTSLLAGCTVFGIMGHLAYVTGEKDISKVASAGTGLAFVSYPDVIAKLDFAPQIFSALFFIMLFALGIGSNVGVVSTIVTAIRDRYPDVPYWNAALGVSVGGFLIGLVYITPSGQTVLYLVDFFGASFIMFVLAIAELVAVAWIYGLNNFCQDILFMLGPVGRVGYYWRLCWGVITPSFMTIVLVYMLIMMDPLTYGTYVYTNGAYALGWSLAGFGLVQVPLWASWAIYKNREKGIYQGMLKAMKPLPSWGPINPEVQHEWIEFKNKEDDKRRASRQRTG